MKQTERKPDKTLADKQKEQAGATATFGQRNRGKYIAITVFALERTASYFLIYFFTCKCTLYDFYDILGRLQRQPTRGFNL